MDSKYRADIDGLRAVSVLSVVLYHAFPDALPAGFIGVDVFFVISGFLITRLVIDAMHDGSFSFRSFYGRRIRRIFPALILVCLVVSFACLGMLTSSELRQYGAHLASVALSVPNLLLWQESGYFDTASEMKLLLHTWSLGVEEQFYFLWPLVLALGFKLRLPPTLVCLGMFLVSFAFSFYIGTSDPTQAFYSPFSRAWELAAGGFLATTNISFARGKAEFVCTAGLLSILVAALILMPEESFPAPSALLPTLGACAVIAAGPTSWASRRLLSARPVRSLGLISYPLYLWHWPILVFTKKAGLTSSTALLFAVAVSVALATATLLLIERRMQKTHLARIVPTLLAGMFTLLIVGIGFNRFDPRTMLYPSEIRSVLAHREYDFGTDARLGICWLTEESGITSFDPSCAPPSDAVGTSLVILGDSYAARLYPGLRSTSGQADNVGQFTVSSCPSGGNQNAYCSARHAEAIRIIKADTPASVILFSRWQAYDHDWTRSKHADDLRQTIADLKSAGISVVVIGPAPEYQPSLPDAVFEHWQREKAGIPVRLHSSSESTMLSVDEQLNRLASSSGAKYVSLAEILCDQTGCLTSSPDNPTDLFSWDYGHLTTSGASFIAERLRSSHLMPGSEP